MKALAQSIAMFTTLAAALSPCATASPCPATSGTYTDRSFTTTPGALYRTPDGRFRVIGYNDMAEMLGVLAARYTERNPAARFAFDLKGTRTAPPALARGISLVAPMGAEFSSDELREYQRYRRYPPLAIRVAHASIDPSARSSPLAFFVNTANPMTTIDLEQARRAFTGRIALTWGDLGLNGAWQQRALVPVGLAKSTALGRYMATRVFGSHPLASQFSGLGESRAVIAAVAADPQALGFANLSGAIRGVRALAIVTRDGAIHRGDRADIARGTYPLDRFLLVYAAREGDGRIAPPAHAWLDFMLSCEGQRLIGAGTLGYLPLNPQEQAEEQRKLRNNNK